MKICFLKRKILSTLLAVCMMLTMLPVTAGAATAPAFATGYPTPGTAQAYGSKKIQVLLKGVLPEGVSSMSVGHVLLASGDPAPTPEQIKSSQGNIPGSTVITWGNYGLGANELPVEVTGKQDNTVYDYYVVCWAGDTFSEVKKLTVQTPLKGNGDYTISPVLLAPPTNLRWDTTSGMKAKWDAVANAASYAVTLYKEGHSTMLIQYPTITGTEVNFQSNIAGNTGNYHFTVQAKAADDTLSLKPASLSYPYTAPLNGTATIDNMSPKIGDTLTGSLNSGNNTGALSYTWKAEDSQVGAAKSYTVAAADLGKTITLEITSDVETGTRTSTATAAVAKKAATAIPSAPTVAAKTHNSVTLNAVPGCKYGRQASPFVWQDSPIFTGLSPSATYIFHQKYKETADTSESEASDGVHVSTNADPGIPGPDPGNPTGTAVWDNRTPLPSSNSIDTVRYVNGKYMAVGENGTLLTSTDGESWQKTIIDSGIDYLDGIAYGGGKYVLVGAVDSIAGRIFTSNDGANWRETATLPSRELSDVAYGNGKFVVVGRPGQVLTSTDAESWTTHPVTYPEGKETYLLSITYSAEKNKFVAVGMRSNTGEAYRGNIMTSEDGVNWTVTYSDTAYTLWDVTYGNNLFVAVGGTDTGPCFIATSNDGTTWTKVSSYLPYARLLGVTWNGSSFVATGSNQTDRNGIAVVSTNGTNWTERPQSKMPSINTVAANGTGRLVAMVGRGNIYTSDDNGVNWSYRTKGTTKTLNDVAYNGSNLYVAVGNEGAIQTSADGQTWAIQTSGTIENLNKVEYLNNQFVAVGKKGTILTSSDGMSWTKQTSGTTRELKGLAFGSGRYMVVGGDTDTNPVVLTSTDGASWQNYSTTSIIQRSFVSVAYGDGVFIAVMQYGQAYRYEEDADTGEFICTPIANLGNSGCYPKDIICAAGQFAAVGGYGEVYLSSNKGASWTLLDTDLDSYSFGIASGGGNLVAVGENGKIMASADGGTTWRLQPSGLTSNHYSSNNYIALKGVTAGNNCFVAVGENGLLLQSESFTVSDDADANAVELDVRALHSGDIITGSNTEHAVTRNINLLATGEVKGSDISWQSSKPAYIAIDGTVTRPALADGDQVVSLTATITKGSASTTKTFVVVVAAAANTVPTTPRNFIATPGNGSVTLSWDAPTGNGGSTITGYQVSSDNGGSWVAASSNTSHTFAGLTNGTAYTFKVRAVNGVGTGAEASATATPTAPPQTMRIVNFYSDGSLYTSKSVVSGSALGSAWPSNPSRSSYTFGGWFDGQNGAGTQYTSPTTISANVDLYAKWTYSGGGSSGGGTVTQPTVPAASGAVQVNYTASSGTATLSLPATKVNEIIEKSKGGKADVDLSKVSSVTATSISKDALTAFAKAGLDVTVKLPVGTITLDDDAAASVAKQASGSNATIELKQAASGTLTTAQKETIKSGNLVLDINIYSGTTKITKFDGTLTVQVSYNGPQPVTVWYLNDKGELEKLNCTFKNGVVSFNLDHLSLYVIGQDNEKPTWKNPFTDVKEADWFYAAVSFCAEKGITNGTSATTFSPNATLTRGQFITMLLKAYGIEPVANPTDNFADAGNTYYTGYLAAAKVKGISNGVGDNKFAPEKAITRQEMFTLLYNALKVLNKLPAADNGKTLTNFTDSGDVASWATEAMTALVKSGTVAGSEGKLDPTGGSTRAQMAQVLYNLLGK